MANPKLLSQVTIDSTQQTLGLTHGGISATVDIAAADYATILEALANLQNQLRGISSDYSVAVSSAGIVTLANTTDTWTIDWATTDAALAEMLGFARTESVATGALTATKRHDAGWYAPAGVQYPPDRRRKATRRQELDDGGMSVYASDVVHRYREFLFECLSEQQVEGGDDGDDGSGSTIDWRDRSLLDFWSYTMGRPFRFYADADYGTVDDFGHEAGAYSWPKSNEFVTCKIMDDKLRPTLRDPGDFSLIDVSIKTKVTGIRTTGGGVNELWSLPLDHVGGCPGVDEYGWPNDAMYDDCCVLDWRDGDGETPTVGPSLTETGDPTSGVATPWATASGTEITASHFDGNDQYVSAETDCDPGASDDVVIMALVRPCEPGDFGTIVSIRDAGAGWTLLRPQNSSRFRITYTGSTTIDVSTNSGSVHYAWSFVVVVIDRDGDTVIYKNGVEGDSSSATPAGTISGDGLGIGSNPGGGSDFTGDIARVVVLNGEGLADTWTAEHVDRVTASVLGYAAEDNNSPTCARDSYQVGYVTHSGVECVHIFGQHAPVAGNARGFLAFQSLTNKVYKNTQIEAGDESILTVSGGTADTADDTSAIEAAGLREIGTEVYTLDNDSGSPQYVRCGSVTGNTNGVALSVRAKYESGSAAELGLYDGTTFTKAADVLDDYARTTGTATPANSSQQWALLVPDGCDLSFTLGCHYEWPSDYCPPEVVNRSDDANETADPAVLTLPSDIGTHFEAEQRRLDATVMPEGWDAGEDGYTHRVVTRASVDAAYMRIDDTNGKVEVGDGTTTAEATIALASRTAINLRTEWGVGVDNDEMRASEVGGAESRAAYDGAMAGSGNHVMWNTNAWLRDIALYDKQAD